MDLIRFLFRQYRTKIIIASLIGAISGIGCSAVIALVHQKLKGGGADTGATAPMFFALIVAYYLLSSWAEYLLLSIAQSELCRLRIEFCRHILSLPLRRLEEIGAPRLFASLTNDIEKIVHTVRQIPTLLINGSMILGASAYMAWLSLPLLAATLLLLVIGIALYAWPLYRFVPLQRYLVRLSEQWEELCRHFHSLTHGTKELLIHAKRRDAFFDHRIVSICLRIRDEAIRGITIHNLVFRWGDTLYLIALGIALFVLSPLLRIENQVMSGYIMAGLFVISPLSSIVNFGPNFGAASVALNNLRQFGMSLDAGPPIAAENRGSAFAGTPSRELIRLSGVAYTYHRGTNDRGFTLGPLDLAIHEGEITFIVGGNGSGKTTLLKLLCGLYVPESGSLYWQGQEVTDENREIYRQFFSVVFSDFYLFDTLFGLESFNQDRRAREFLTQLQLDRKVGIEGGRLSSVDLSQGQRKRLALLVAYLEDRPVYIFDEWAADQDPVFKRVFYNELLPEMKATGKTLLVITHDDRWFDLADRIVKLRDGGIADDAAL
jgi:putative pyoverdin transport system ATP-binding/permease protein